MKAPLHIAPDLSLPLDAVTQTIAVIGIRGSGKTNTGVVISEELLDQGQQVVILDPVDVWWGLKSSKDGKAPAFSIPIIGGEHGDVPLEGSGGVIIADFVVDSRASAIISIRHLSINEQRRFAGDFARRLYERKGPAEFRSPMMLVVDEADEFIPQKIPPGHEAMFGAFDRIARRGRSSGLGMLAITQRPQVMNKDVLSQMEVLIAHRVLHKLDRGALDSWIEAHDTAGRREEFMASLASLDRGDAWAWSPSWLNIFQRVHIRARKTFDSSATPEAGHQIAPPKRIAEVDLAKLGAKLTESIEAAKANDPRELRKLLAEARKEIEKLKSAAPAPAGLDKEALKREFERGANSVRRELGEELRRYHAGIGKTITDTIGHLQNMGSRLTASADEIRAIPEFPHSLDSVIELVKSAPTPIRAAQDPTAKRPPVSRPEPRVRAATVGGAGSDHSLSPGERGILTACVQHWETGCTPKQLSVLCGYKRSSRDTYIQRLRGKGLLNPRGPGGAVMSTAEGRAALGEDFEPLPTGEALREYWLNRLSGGERVLLGLICAGGPVPVSRDELEEKSGYKRSARDTYLQRLAQRKLIVPIGRGQVQASEDLFG